MLAYVRVFPTMFFGTDFSVEVAKDEAAEALSSEDQPPPAPKPRRRRTLSSGMDKRRAPLRGSERSSSVDAAEKPEAEAADSSQESAQGFVSKSVEESDGGAPSSEGEEKSEIEDDFDEDEESGEPIIFHLSDLKNKTPEELLDIADSLSITNSSNMGRHDLVFNILKKLSYNGGIMKGGGIAEIMNEGYAFLRSPESDYMQNPDDIYISPNQVKRLGVKGGDQVYGTIRPPKKNEKYFALVKAESINNQDPSKSHHRVHFDDLTPLYPSERIILELEHKSSYSQRVIDIVSPIGKGQRALIVAPPKTGKTTLMQDICKSISENHPEMKLIVFLVGERPEEVTDMARSVKAEVVSSTFDEPASRHVQLAEIVIEKAKRLVENREDVVIFLDSITRLARAYNNVAPSSGKVLSGGVDSNALQRPKRFFGAARNIEEGGSLTIIGTALVDTGSRMDEVIFEEFKGTGNSEIVLDRKISDKRTFPAIDIVKSGTRKEELLVDQVTLSKMWVLRKILSSMSSVDAIEFLLDKLSTAKTNANFFDSMSKK